MSPDGKYVITRFVEVFSEKEQRTWSTLTETKTEKIINASLNGSAAGCCLSGSTLYYTVKRGDSYDLRIYRCRRSLLRLYTDCPQAT